MVFIVSSVVFVILGLGAWHTRANSPNLRNGLEPQQPSSDLSSTYFILFFASAEIAYNLYIHSNEKDGYPNHKKNYKKHEYIEKSGQEYG